MFQSIQKRDGRIVSFEENKIAEAIYKAIQSSNAGLPLSKAYKLSDQVVAYLKTIKPEGIPTVEEVHDAVEHILIKNKLDSVAKQYILYRAQRTRVREAKSDLMDAVEEILVETNRENANIGNSPSAKMLQIASAASKKYYLTKLIPEEFAKAHRDGDIHIHDLDFYAKTLTCVQIPLGKMLKNGFDNGHGFIRPPKRIGSAAALSCIILQSSQNDMHGGQSFAFYDRDMAPFVGNATDDEIYQAMESVIYNLNSMHSRAGAQVPFSSINLGCDTSEAGRKVTRGLLLAHEAGLGHGETPIFPNIIFRLKEGINFNPEDTNYDLFRLAMRVSSKRLNPTFSFMDSSFNQEYGTDVAYMGCRTRTISDRHGKPVTDGRGNLSFTTINLPRLAIKANGDIDKFNQMLKDMMVLVGNQLVHRFGIQAALKVKDMPFLMGQHVYLDSDDLQSDSEIREVIKHGTLSVGFIGLAEALISLCGKHHGESAEAQQLGLDIVSYMREVVDELADKYDLNFTLLATPAEGLSGRFVNIDRKIYGEIPGVTNKEFYTNSFHVPVDFPMLSFKKIEIEGPYHGLTNAGHISYIELASPPINNIDAYETIIKHMSKNDMGYAGINFPVDECRDCNFSGIIEDRCPKCGSQNICRIRRITGYLSTVDRFNDAKKAELNKRVKHM